MRILWITISLLSLLLCLASIILWIQSRLAPPAVATGLVNLTPDPDRWSIYAQDGSFFLLRERSILDPADLPRLVKSPPGNRAVLGFGAERSLTFHNWPVNRGTLNYGTVLNFYYCPIWACAVIFLIPPLIELPRMTRNFRRRRRGLCLNCGYDLRASPAKCPECGTSVRKNKMQKRPLPAPR